MNRTEPSANAGVEAARDGASRHRWSEGLAFGSNFRSSGLVQGTASFDSTTMIVFDVPSVTFWIARALALLEQGAVAHEDPVGRRARLGLLAGWGRGKPAASP